MTTEADLRQELLKRITTKRASITAFMRGVRPVLATCLIQRHTPSLCIDIRAC
jgi:hypothetical protein